MSVHPPADSADRLDADPVARSADGRGVSCFIGLGSNLGDREGYLRAAVASLDATPGVRVRRASSIYESEPWGYRAQPAYLNAVVDVFTTLGPIQLLTALQTIERRLGREKRFRWGPREIDLDILLYGQQSVNHQGFNVPHSSMYERAFVLAPLAELEPGLTTPAGEPLASAVRSLDPHGDQAIFQALPLFSGIASR